MIPPRENSLDKTMTDNGRHISLWFRLLLLGAICVILGLLLMTWLGIPASWPKRLDLSDPKDVKMVLDKAERKMDVRFPKETVLLRTSRFSYFDDYILLQVEVPRTSLDSFLKSSPFAGQALDENGDLLIGKLERLGWVSRESLGKYDAKRLDLPPVVISILVTHKDQDTFTIFLYWFR